MPEPEKPNTAINSVSVAVANESVAEVPEAVTALKTIGMGLLLTIAAALGNFLASIAPEMVNVVTAFLPAWAQGWAAPALTTAVLTAAAWLQSQSRKQTKAAVVESLTRETPDKLKSMYRSDAQ